MGRVFLADPALKDAQGEHFEKLQAISMAAKAHGQSVIWLVNNDFSEAGSNIDPEIKVIPTFSSEMHDGCVKHSMNRSQSMLNEKESLKPGLLKKIFKLLPYQLQKKVKRKKKMITGFLKVFLHHSTMGV